MIQLNLGWLFLLNADSRPMFGLELQTFIDMIPLLVNFTIFALVMSWLLYKPVKKILQERANRVEGDLNDAALSKASASELKAMYEQKVRDIEVERDSILSEARKQAGERRTQILEDAKQEAQGVKEKAAKDIASEREQIKSAVVEAIVDISADMAERLISTSLDKNAHEKLFAEAMAELEATTAFKTEAIA